MYDTLIRWIGWKTCSFAGSVTDVLDTGPACVASQARNVGVVALVMVALSFTVMVINARRRHHRESYLRG